MIQSLINPPKNNKLKKSTTVKSTVSCHYASPNAGAQPPATTSRDQQLNQQPVRGIWGCWRRARSHREAPIMKPDPPIIQAAPQRLHWQTWHTRITWTRRTRLSHDRHSESTRTHSANDAGHVFPHRDYTHMTVDNNLKSASKRGHPFIIVFFLIFVISKLICDCHGCGQRGRYICCLTSRDWRGLGECSRPLV